jgi:hypothetical protein
MSTPTFEDRLLNELQDVVRTQPSGRPGRPHRTRNRSLAGAAAAAAATTVAALLLTGGASPAYAVDEHNGTVTVTIKSLSDAAGLQKALRDKGVHAYVDYTPTGKACQQPRGSVMPGKGTLSSSMQRSDGITTFSIDPSTLTSNESLVIESSGGSAQTTVGIQIIEGPVAACKLVDASAVPAPPGSVTHSDTGGSSGGDGPGTVTSRTG